MILMCTDGLSNMVEDEDMFNIVKGSRDVVEAVQMLIEKANSNGGRDNITVIVCRVEKEINYLEKVFRKRAFK